MNKSLMVEMVTAAAETAAAAGVSHFSLVDYSVFAALLIVSVAIGLYFGFFSKEEQTTEEYLQGGHKMQPLPIAISLVASQLSAVTVLTFPSEIYSFGWQFAFILPAISAVTIASNYLIVPVFYNNSIDNCYAYLEMRFCKSVRNIVTTLFLFLGMLQMPIFLFVPSLAYSEVTGQNLFVVNTVVCFCCVTYTMLGGIKAVVWTDVVQAFFMVLSIVLVALYGVQQVGGLTVVWDRAVAGGRIFPPIMTLDLTTRQTFWNMILGTFIMWTCHISFHQNCVQRIVSLPTLAISRQSLIMFCIGVTILMFFNLFTGIIMYAYYYDCDPLRAHIVSKADKMVPRFVEDVVGHIGGMPGVFISCVFSASLSAVSATMNSSAGIIYLDYIKPLKFYRHTERRANLIMKTIVILLGIECAFGAFFVARFASILQLLLTIGGTINGAKFGIFTLGMLYPWANRHGALYGVLAGMATVTIIIVNTQIAVGKGEFGYDTLPTSIEGCSNDTIVANLIQNNATITVNDTFAWSKISYMWYGPIGAAVTWIVGVSVSYLTGGQDITETNISLLSPFIQNLLPQKYHHTQLQVITEKQPLELEASERTHLKNEEVLDSFKLMEKISE